MATGTAAASPPPPHVSSSSPSLSSMAPQMKLFPSKKPPNRSISSNSSYKPHRGFYSKFKYGRMALIRAQSEAALRRSKSFTDTRGRLCSAPESQGIPTDEEMLLLTTDMPPRSSPVFQGQRSRSESKLFSPLVEKEKTTPSTKLSKRESLKVQKKHYRKEKKRAAKELLSTLKDPSVIVMADWLKVRGTLKGWTKLWCVLKPGLFVLYKSHKQKAGSWVGTILLNTCELIERPSKKDGFCYKLFHPLEQSIWAPKGPKGETIGAITQPLPYSYLIFRAPSEAAGKCWMDALELALRCSSLLMRTMTREKSESDTAGDRTLPPGEEDICDEEDDEITFLSPPFRMTSRDSMNESDCERHFKGIEADEDTKTDKEGIDEKSTESEHSEEEENVYDEDLQPIETQYSVQQTEELGQQGDACQTEEVADENKSLIWTLMKQVRPGMDLSKVVLPTFILEPRSFLDKLSDYYFHADFLSEAVLEEDPYTRIKEVIKWYIAGFYKKPKGLKKPYNPILGETFRCYWKHPRTRSRTFYISEQISHHPPVSAFYVTNRQDGFSISGSILAKSKFYGNSVSAIMDGVGRLTFLKRGEDYLITMPYAHCKGILIGTLTMELGGKVAIECEKTGYRAELEFKLKPFLGSGEASNRLTGKIKLGSETLSTLDGKWDQEVFIKDKATGESQLFWNPTPEIKAKRLKRYTVPTELQEEFESERLWSLVSVAVAQGDQNAATQEKFILEEAQRKSTKERKAKMEEWLPRLFERDEITGDWVYKYADLRPWDAMNDVLQYENDYIIQTKTRHRTPVVRTTSITNVDESASGTKRVSSSLSRSARIKRASIKQLSHGRSGGHLHQSGTSTPDHNALQAFESSDSAVEDGDKTSSGNLSHKKLTSSLSKALEPLVELQRQNNQRLNAMQGQMTVMQRQIRSQGEEEQLWPPSNRDMVLLAIVLVFQMLAMWIMK